MWDDELQSQGNNGEGRTYSLERNSYQVTLPESLASDLLLLCFSLSMTTMTMKGWIQKSPNVRNVFVVAQVFKLYKNKECGLDSVSVFPVITAVSLHNVNMQNMAKTCLHLQCSVCTRTLYSLALLVLYRLGRRYSSESTQTSLSCLLTRGTSLAPAELSVPSPWDKQDTETKWRRTILGAGCWFWEESSPVCCVRTPPGYI